MTRFPLFLLVLSGFFVTAAPLYAEEGKAESAIARVWLERGIHLLDAGLTGENIWPELNQALARSREFDAPGSDYHYLLALSLLLDPAADESDSDRSAFDLLSSSLDEAAGNDLVSFDSKAGFWCAVALRDRRYEQISRRYDRWPAGLQLDPVLLYAAGRSALYQGYSEQAAELARKGESLSGPATDLSVLGAAFQGAALPRFRALAVAAGDDSSIETLVDARRWGAVLDEALIPWVLEGSVGIGDLEAYLPYASDNLKQIIGLLSGRPGNLPAALKSDLAFLRILDRQGNTEALDYLSGFTGTLRADSNYDGYPEETVELLAGKPRYRSIDADQNGTPEWYLAYDSGLPLQVRENGGLLTVNYVKAAYPSVLSIVEKDGDSRVEYSFRPGAYSREIRGNDYLRDIPHYDSGNPAAIWEALNRVTVETDFTGEFPEHGQHGRVVSYFVDGYPVMAREFRYLDGQTDPLWVREMIYRDGVIIAGRRSYRSAGSGDDERIWELYERYEDGILVGLAWDPGMTGSPSYLRDWALERVLETQVWDLQGDGWVDYRRFTFPDRSDAAELLISELTADDLLPWNAADWAPWQY